MGICATTMDQKRVVKSKVFQVAESWKIGIGSLEMDQKHMIDEIENLSYSSHLRLKVLEYWNLLNGNCLEMDFEVIIFQATGSWNIGIL